MLARQVTKSFKGYMDALIRFGSARVSIAGLEGFEAEVDKSSGVSRMQVDGSHSSHGAGVREDSA